jgi:transcription termination/antitermination protein NusG
MLRDATVAEREVVYRTACGALAPDADLQAPDLPCFLKQPGRWWVVHTRARNEKQVAAALAARDVCYYLPVVRVQRTYAKSRFTFDIPLFSCYLFLCGDRECCEVALRTHRVAGILHVADQDELRAELQHICRVLESGQTIELYPALQIGQRCRVTAGPLRGVEGVVVRHGGRCRMYLAVSMLGQSAMVELDAALLTAVA